MARIGPRRWQTLPAIQRMESGQVYEAGETLVDLGMGHVAKTLNTEILHRE